MFIVAENPDSRVLPTLQRLKEQIKTLPPHFELLASIHPKRFEMFMNEIEYLQNHPNIQQDFFAFIRLFIASKEEFAYCKHFNTKLLLSKAYTKESIKNVQKDIAALPLDDKHVLLAKKAVKAVYFSEQFTGEDIAELLESGWSQADIYDAIDHACFLFKNARIIKAYTA